MARCPAVRSGTPAALRQQPDTNACVGDSSTPRQSESTVPDSVRRGFAMAPLALALCPHAQHAYASKPVKLIVPFPPGGNADLNARILAPGLAKALGRAVIVENRAGAGGILGLDAVAKSVPDGDTVGIASPVNHLVAPLLHPRLPYDSIHDFAPVGLISSVPMVLVVGASSPVKSVRELLALARSRQGAMTMASVGAGSASHIAGKQFQDATGTKFVHVRYKGSAPANTDLAGGHVDVRFDQLSSVLPLVQGGKLWPIALAAATRSTLLPEVPTLAEAGVAHLHASTTLGVVLPGKAPPELVARLNRALCQVLMQPVVKGQFARRGAEVRPSTPAEYMGFIHAETTRMATVLKHARITLD